MNHRIINRELHHQLDPHEQVRNGDIRESENGYVYEITRAGNRTASEFPKVWRKGEREHPNITIGKKTLRRLRSREITRVGDYIFTSEKKYTRAKVGNGVGISAGTLGFGVYRQIEVAEVEG